MDFSQDINKKCFLLSGQHHTYSYSSFFANFCSIWLAALLLTLSFSVSKSAQASTSQSRQALVQEIALTLGELNQSLPGLNLSVQPQTRQIQADSTQGPLNENERDGNLTVQTQSNRFLLNYSDGQLGELVQQLEELKRDLSRGNQAISELSAGQLWQLSCSHPACGGGGGCPGGPACHQEEIRR